MASPVRIPPPVTVENRFSALSGSETGMVSLGKVSKKRARAETSLDSSSISIPSPKRNEIGSFTTSTPDASLITPAQSKTTLTPDCSGFDLERAIFPESPKLSYAQAAAAATPPSPPQQLSVSPPDTVSPDPSAPPSPSPSLRDLLTSPTTTQPQTKADSPPPPPSSKSTPAALAVLWTFYTIQIVGLGVQKAKMEGLIKAFIHHVGAPFIKVDQVQARSFRVKVRDTHIGKLNTFQHGATDLSIKTLYKYNSKKTEKARGIINIPNNTNFDQFESKIKKQNAEIESIRPNPLTQTASVTFKNNDAPVTLKGLVGLVKPAFLSVIRCQNCQMFGHKNIKNSCRNETKCPHCAGKHTHRQCTNKKTKKCANCQGPHSAAYRGCTHFLAYQRKINGSNSAIEFEFNNKCEKQGIQAPKLEPHSKPKSVTPAHTMTNKDITLLSKKLENKTASQIIDILKEHLNDPRNYTPTPNSDTTTQAVTQPIRAKETTTQAASKPTAKRHVAPREARPQPINRAPTRPPNRPTPHYRPRPNPGHYRPPFQPVPLMDIRCRPYNFMYRPHPGGRYGPRPNYFTR